MQRKRIFSDKEKEDFNNLKAQGDSFELASNSFSDQFKIAKRPTSLFSRGQKIGAVMGGLFMISSNVFLCVLFPPEGALQITLYVFGGTGTTALGSWGGFKIADWVPNFSSDSESDDSPVNTSPTSRFWSSTVTRRASSSQVAPQNNRKSLTSKLREMDDGASDVRTNSKKLRS